MEIVIEIVKVLLPSVVVFLTAFFILKFFIENEQKKKILELRYNSKSVITPIRLQAYERMALFLERMDPNQLLLRMNNPQLTAFQFQLLLISAIRSEYDHNLSQQIYLSAGVWNHIKQAKEETIRIINLCAGKLADSDMATDLATAILEQIAEKSPIEEAMKKLKEEIEALF